MIIALNQTKLFSTSKLISSTLAWLFFCLLITCPARATELSNSSSQTRSVDNPKEQHLHKPLRVAVATNFLPALQKLVPAFEQQQQIKVELISAASGTLMQQIIHGAPFDLFLSADAQKPQMLEAKNLIVKNSRQTYAIGQLALAINVHQQNNQTLIEQQKFCNTQQKSNIAHCLLAAITKTSSKLAIANEKIAPYGLAAKQVLTNFNLWQPMQTKLVRGANVGQTFQQLRAQVVDYALVAYTQLKINRLNSKNLNNPDLNLPLHIVLKPTAYQTINQQLVILKNAEQQLSKAQLFVDFLLSSRSQQAITEMGYLTPSTELIAQQTSLGGH